jgi:hypothetical protein
MTVHITLFCLGIVAFLINWSARKKKMPRGAEHSAAAKDPLEMTPYEFLRERALALTPDEMRYTSAPDADPYSIVMDIALRRGTATLVCVADGSSSLYLSTGRGTIGSDACESTRNAVIEFMELSRYYVSMMTPVHSHALPQVGNIAFYVLTKRGTYSAGDTFEKIMSGNSPWSRLFTEASKVTDALGRECAMAKKNRARLGEGRRISGGHGALAS